MFLLMSNINGELTLHEYEKFPLTKVNVLTYNWSYSFTTESAEDDFNVYAILVDKFNDNYMKAISAEMENMGSIESVIGKLRKTDRIDPLNFSVFWVRVN